MATNIEFLPMVEKLFEKTKAGKIEWKPTYDSATFICVLEGEYSFEIEKSKSDSGSIYCGLTMKDKDKDTVFVAQAFRSTPTTTAENDQVYSVLAELFERARRIALNVDKKVNEVKNILDKM